MFENFKSPSNLIPSDPRFGSGPSLIPVEFLEQLKGTGDQLLGTSHRKPPVKKLVKGIQEGFQKYFSLPEGYLVALGNGGATFLFDMIALGLVKKKITHFTCGEFSDKWFKASDLVPWIESEKVSVPYGEGVLGEDRADSDVIAVTLNETSTGVHLPEIPQIDKDTLLCVDATSGGGQVPCDVSKVDVFFLSPQKVFASEGGLWVAVLSPKAQKRAKEIAEDSSRYIPQIMSWTHAITNSEKNQTYNTPAISSLFFLNRQVERMVEQGPDEVISLAKEKAKHVYSWAMEKEYLSPFIQDEKFRSVAVATVDVDDKVDVSALLKVLEAEKTVYGIDPYRKLGRNQFRISLFHNIQLEDLKKLTALLSKAIEEEL
jgi:phosphoserine aminotransferase